MVRGWSLEEDLPKENQKITWAYLVSSLEVNGNVLFATKKGISRRIARKEKKKKQENIKDLKIIFISIHKTKWKMDIGLGVFIPHVPNSGMVSWLCEKWDYICTIRVILVDG